MKSLYAILADEPLATLQSLASWWGTDAPAHATTEDRQRLERSMRDAIAARFVWERLSETERRTLFAIVGPSARNWALIEDLPARTQATEEETRVALALLVNARLVFTEQARVQGSDLVGQRVTFYGYVAPRNPQAQIEEKEIAYVPTELATGLYATGREIFYDHADRSTKTLDELLTPYRQGDLDQIGRRFGLTLHAYYSRNEVRAAIAENLQQAEAVRYALARLDVRVRETYEWLRARGGKAPIVELRSRLHVSDIELAAFLRALEEYALAFDTFSGGERTLFIPQETLAHLKRSEAQPQAPIGLRETTEPGATLPSDTSFMWDLIVLVAAASQQEIELTRSGSLPKRAAQRLLPFLTGQRARISEEEALVYIELLRQEACDLGLVVAQGGGGKDRARLTPGPRLDSWARHDLVMQARRLYRRWPTDRWWSDLAGAQYHEWQTFYLDIPVAREAVHKLLITCEPGVWYTLESFRATLQGGDPYVLRPSQRYAGESGFKMADGLRAQWEFTDGEIITGMFRSTLYELGLVTLGYEGDTAPDVHENINPTSFMLTELGAEALKSDLSARDQPSKRSLVVQPNFQALLMEPFMPALYWLARFATLEQVGRVSRFTLTREALQRGLDTGVGIDEVIVFLEEHAQKALPQNIVYSLRDWARQRREQSREAPKPLMTLEAANERLAREIVTDPQLRAFQLERVGSRGVAIPPNARLRELRRALERNGYAQKLLSGFDDLVAACASLPSGRSRSAASRAALNGAKGLA
jgi:Helicase conserved C-terminal domain